MIYKVKVRPGSRPALYTWVEAGPGKVSLLTLAQQIVYMTVPELSVDGFHVSDTLYGVVPVTRRLVGVVGGLRSLAASTGDAAKTVPRIRATIAQSLAISRIFILICSFSLQESDSSRMVRTRIYSIENIRKEYSCGFTPPDNLKWRCALPRSYPFTVVPRHRASHGNLRKEEAVYREMKDV
jgi:hypothetical protein